MLKPVAELLRRGRTAVAETLGAAVAAIPALERPFVAAGKGAARWYCVARHPSLKIVCDTTAADAPLEAAGLTVRPRESRRGSVGNFLYSKTP